MRPLLLLLLSLLSACATSSHERAPPPDASVSPELARGGAAPGRSITRTARLELERSDPQKGPEEGVTLAKAHGGYAQLVTNDSVTARIPAPQLDAFLASAAKLGHVVAQQVVAEDVTEVHRDLRVRLEILTRTRERYLELLGKAANVSETVLVEKELERVTVEYESLRARLEALEGAVAQATVQLDFSRPVRPGPLGWVFYGLAKGVKWLFVWD